MLFEHLYFAGHKTRYMRAAPGKTGHWADCKKKQKVNIKHIGHIHYACPISGMTDKKNRFQSKDEYWDSI